MSNLQHLQDLSKLIRYDILTSTTQAGSGHPTSSLSAVELMTTLFFGGYYHYNLKNPQNLANDRFVLSKGHASPLLYSLYHVAGAITYEELMTLRQFGSRLEGHPTPRFPYVDVATGSLGQGLSMGLGMALGMRLKNQQSNVFVLMGDSEMAEGQVWEAMEIASYYKLNNLVGIVDVNRLGQRGETMLGWDIDTYVKRIEAFGWITVTIGDGNNLDQVLEAYKNIDMVRDKPLVFIAKTVKGKGVSLFANQNGWHGKVLNKEQLKQALDELGEINLNVRGKIAKPSPIDSVANVVAAIGGSRERVPDGAHVRLNRTSTGGNETTDRIYRRQDMISTREAYGDALISLGDLDKRIVVLDAEVSNSTYSDKFKDQFPDRFFEMFIAEQNMVSTALGVSKTGYIPFISTFSAFFTRTFDQIRMSQYSNANLKIVGSHCGVSIGEDGPSQMGLEDIALMRSILSSIVLYPSDATSCFNLTQIMAQTQGICYLRTTRGKMPIIYEDNEKFEIGGSKVLKQSDNDVAVVFAAGITLHEALKAYETLKKDGVEIAVVDLYSIKPIDNKTIIDLAKKAKNVLVVEDHYPSGGLGEAVLTSISNFQFLISHFIHLCVKKIPQSGKPEELLRFEEIDSLAIVKKVKSFITT